MKVKVNQESCVGCGACAAVAEGVFELQDDGLSHEVNKEVPKELEEVAKEAMSVCPTGAIEEVK